MTTYLFITSILFIFLGMRWMIKQLKSKNPNMGLKLLRMVTLTSIGIVVLFFLTLVPYTVKESIREYELLKTEYLIYSTSPRYQELSDIQRADLMKPLLEYQDALKTHKKNYQNNIFLRAFIPEEIEKVEFLD